MTGEFFESRKDQKKDTLEEIEAIRASVVANLDESQEGMPTVALPEGERYFAKLRQALSGKYVRVTGKIAADGVISEAESKALEDGLKDQPAIVLAVFPGKTIVDSSILFLQLDSGPIERVEVLLDDVELTMATQQ